jgi:hypothetical protein
MSLLTLYICKFLIDRFTFAIFLTSCVVGEGVIDILKSVAKVIVRDLAKTSTDVRLDRSNSS